VHRFPPPFDRFATQLRYRLKQFLGRHPWLYRAVFQNRSGYKDLLVNDDTDICIEGFPRSANSFAVAAFRHAQDEPVGIAHHNHVPASVITAIQNGLPTVVLIRDPVEAVISNRGLQLQIGAVEDKEMPMHLSFEAQLNAWQSFYETVWPHRDQVVVAPFETVIDDFGLIIDRANARFGTEFDRFEHTTANVEAIRSSRGYHALPSEQRRALKQQAHARFVADVGTEHDLMTNARSFYDRFAATAADVSASNCTTAEHDSYENSTH
jgi:hypothetical protein